MRALEKKLFRNLLSMKGQAVAIALIVACGVSSWVTVLTAYRSLLGTRDAYYAEYRMADLNAPVKKAPRSVATRLEEIPGVRRVRPRIVFEVLIDMEEVVQPCLGRVLTLPDRRERVINDVHLTSGAWFTGDGSREVVIGDRFAKEHDLTPGDVLRVVMNNRKETLRIAATALSPEFVYMIRGAGEFIPDPVHFTVLWLSESFAESAFDFTDSANEFVATLDRDAPLDTVIEDFDRELDRFGAVGAFGREDQISNRYLSDEIKGLRGTATITPTIFLGVAAFVLHMLLGRLVQTQRTEIAVFRAFGYGTGDVVLHYLKLSMLIGAVGAVLGIAAGVYFAKYTLQAYQQFYQFPLLRFRVDPLVLLSGLGVSLGFAALGAASAARKAARLHPAEGLRPEAPGVYRRTFLERWPALFDLLGPLWRMVVRHIARARLRSALTVGGVALSGGIIFLALFSTDSMDELVTWQARVLDHQDATVVFNSERGTSALYEVRRVAGVTRAEPELIVAAKLVNGFRHKRVGILGLDPEGDLRGLVDRHLNPVAKPTTGLLLTKKLAEILGVEKGDHLEVRVLTGRKQVFRAPVEGTVDEYLGASAYADLRTLSRWVGEEEALNSVRLLVDGAKTDELSAELKALPAVESVTFKDQVVENFRDTLAASMGIMTAVTTIFAGTIAFGVIYNASRIALAERERTLASLRVLGFTQGEVSSIIVRENLVLATAGILPGLGLGVLFSILLARAYDTDLYRFPVVITEKSLLLTALAIFAFAILANLAVRRRIKRLDLVESLKSRE